VKHCSPGSIADVAATNLEDLVHGGRGCISAAKSEYSDRSLFVQQGIPEIQTSLPITSSQIDSRSECLDRDQR